MADEARKLGGVLLVLMAFGVIVLAIEWLSPRVKRWRVLIIASLVLLVMALLIHAARAHDHNRPQLNDWMAGLHSKGKVWCCRGDDDDPIDDWETKGDHYRVKFRGQWFDVPDDAIVSGPNKASDALLWMNKGWGGLTIRCFMPGPMT